MHPEFRSIDEDTRSPVSLTIRRALVADAMPLTGIAIAGKRFWGYPERWIEQWQPELTITPAYIGKHDVFLAEAGGPPLGFYALEVQQSGWRLQHLWVDPPHIRRGVGRHLFAHAVERVRAVRPAPIEIISDPFAEVFYLKMGAERVGAMNAAMDDERRKLPVLRFDVAAAPESDIAR